MRVTTSTARRSEAGFAMVAAVAAIFVAALIVVILAVAVRAITDQEADSKTASLARTAANEGLDAYMKALTGQMTGEQYGFVFHSRAIQSYVSDTPGGGPCAGAGPTLCYMPNSNFAANAETLPYSVVDPTYIPAGDQITVRRQISPAPNPSYAFWQVIALAPPQYGGLTGGNNSPPVSPGGQVVIYVRGWTGAANGVGFTKPAIVRATIRPPLFSDYEMLIETKMFADAGTIINGRMHSNGLPDSFNDVLNAGNQIDVTGATCTASARITTATGGISASGFCNNAQVKFPGTGQLISMMHATQNMAWLRTQCGLGGPAIKVPVYCVGFGPRPSDNFYTATLSGNTVTIGGAARQDFDVTNTVGRGGWGATGQSGAVIVVPGAIKLTGRLGNNGRATIVSVANGSEATYGDTPSIRIESGGDVGAANSNGVSNVSALGLIAPGDVQAIQRNACALHLKAAVVTIGGMLSMDPDYRNMLGLAGPAPARRCRGTFEMEGSVAGHYNPFMELGGVQGYTGRRRYSYDTDLYNNPPPLFPKSGAWEMQDRGDADLACFTEATVRLNPARAGCTT